MKRKMKRIIALCAGLGVFCATGARAADLDIRAFFGTFEGGAIAKNEDSIYFGVTARDTDVTIEPAGDGFQVSWTSIIHSGGTPGNPDTRRKSSAVGFEKTARPQVWRATNSGDPATGSTAGWARIHNRTLSVYLMVVLDDGTYELPQYDRTLTGLGMELVFTRLRDGDQVRSVKGRLVKVAK